MNWWHYLLLVNIYLVLFYAFYALLLRKETFFQLNRVYLVSASLLSFLIPMIQSEWVKNLFITEQVRYTIYGGGAINIYAYKPVESSPLTIGQVLTVLYIGGIIFLTIRLVIQLIRVNKMIKTPAPAEAYSFFKKISLGENFVKQDAVLAHEQVHAQQWHSVDVLLIETVMIINWFNPIVYLYRFAIKHIHEFIADQQALKVGADKAEYALLLLSQTFSAPSHRLVNPFYNHSLLKKRILMIQKNRSQRIVLFKYILSAPLFGLMLVLSSATINNSKAVSAIHKNADKLFVQPAVTSITEIVDNGKIPDILPVEEQPAAAIDESNDKEYQQLMAAIDTTHDKVYESVEKEPSFAGGIDAFYAFLAKTIRYPAADRNNNVTGKVFVRFIVEKDGSLSNVKALRGPSNTINDEAVRAISLSPRWDAGIQGGKAVRVQYTIPVNFTLSVTNVVSRLPSGVPGPPVATNGVYESVESEPSFPGGIQRFFNFLAANVRYPAVDRNNGVTGKVFIQFIVEKDGSLSDVKAIRGPSNTINEEAVRVVSQSPKWTPGTQNGNPVRVQYTVPVNFTLNKDEPPVSTPPIHFDNTGRITIDNGSNPLIIVDGVEYKDGINNINPGSIESIVVLKEPASTKQYGDKGANGVILITTNKKATEPVKPAIKN